MPVGQLGVRRYCGLEGEITPLATLKGGAPLLARVATSRGGVYFCSTTADRADSSLAAGGVVLYVLVQRALAAGATVLEATRQLAAGDPAGDDPHQWQRLAGAEEALSTDYALQPRRLRLGRAAARGQPSGGRGRRAGPGRRRAWPSCSRGSTSPGSMTRPDNAGSLIQEIWRLFLVAMMVAMVVEAALCLPKPVRPGGVRP